jgi:hypothetical protein
MKTPVHPLFYAKVFRPYGQGRIPRTGTLSGQEEGAQEKEEMEKTPVRFPYGAVQSRGFSRKEPKIPAHTLYIGIFPRRLMQDRR